MPDIPDELLMAYADNEINAHDRSRVEDYLLDDPRAAQRLAVFSSTGKVLSLVFDQPMREPVPQRLVDTVLKGAADRSRPNAPRGADIIAFDRTRPQRPLTQQNSPQHWFLAAACAGILAMSASLYYGTHLSGSAPEDFGLAAMPDGSHIAGAEIASALDTVPSGARVEKSIAGATAAIKPVFTFASNGGGYCRQYEITKPDASSLGGVACRTGDGQWRIEGQTGIEAQASGNGAIKPAGKSSAAAIEDIVDRIIAGDVLGMEQEGRIMKNAWRNPSASTSEPER